MLKAVTQSAFVATLLGEPLCQAPQSGGCQYTCATWCGSIASATSAASATYSECTAALQASTSALPAACQLVISEAKSVTVTAAYVTLAAAMCLQDHAAVT